MNYVPSRIARRVWRGTLWYARHVGSVQSPRSSQAFVTGVRVLIRSYATQTEETEKKLNIYVKDLDATLEAHRRWNQGHVFRYETHDHDEEDRVRFMLSESKTHKKGLQGDLTIAGTGVQGKGNLDRAKNLLEDYEGQAKPLTSGWAIRGDLDDAFKRPWIIYKGDEASKHAFDQIGRELKAFESYMSLTSEEEAAGRAVADEINKALGPRWGLRIVGSRKRGLASSLSDLDLAIPTDAPAADMIAFKKWNRRGGSQSRALTIMLLQTVRNRLAQRQIVNTTEIVYARVPILQMKHTATGLVLQVSGPTDTAIQDEVIADYLSDFENLRPIFMALRHSIQMRGLTKVYEGGLGSYSLFMMVAGVLKLYANELKQKSLGEVFLFVVKYWASFDRNNQGLMVEPPRLFAKRRDLFHADDVESASPQLLCLQQMERYRADKPFLLCLQDPSDFSNDLGRKSYAIKHIQVTLGNLYNDTMSLIEDTPSSVFYQPTDLSILAPFLEGNYYDLEQRRSQIEWLLRTRNKRPQGYGSSFKDQNEWRRLPGDNLKREQRKAKDSKITDLNSKASSKEQISKSIRQHQMGTSFPKVSGDILPSMQRIVGDEPVLIRKFLSDRPGISAFNPVNLGKDPPVPGPRETQRSRPESVTSSGQAQSAARSGKKSRRRKKASVDGDGKLPDQADKPSE